MLWLQVFFLEVVSIVSGVAALLMIIFKVAKKLMNDWHQSLILELQSDFESLKRKA